MAATYPMLSLWQPYASLIFAHRKKHETRTWAFPERMRGQIIALQATKAFTPTKLISDRLHELCMDEFGCNYNQTLPRGAVLGLIRLDACYPTDIRKPRDDDDFVAGGWEPGRWAWELTVIHEFAKPEPFLGKQGWGVFPMAESLAA